MSVLRQAVDAAIAERQRKFDRDRYYNDPVLWAKEMADITLWSKQREIAYDVVHSKNIAVKAGHGLGKSMLVAVLICWWVDTRYPHVFVASTAPSTAQIGAIVWREIRRLYQIIEKRYEEGIIDHKLPGYINRDNKNNEWRDRDGVLIGFGRKPPDGKEDDNFQGIHDGHVLAVGDEAVGLSKEMIEALRNITSNDDSRRIIIANPTNPASYMGQIFRNEDSAWSKHTISVLESPNFTKEAKELPEEVLKRLSGPQYVEDMKKDHGETDPRYISRVLGEFAFDRANSLIKYEDIVVGWDTEITPSLETLPEMGVDVARYGDDSSVAYLNHDGQIRLLESWSKTSGTDTARAIHRLAQDHSVGVVKIDGTGMGGPIVDMVTELSQGKYLVVDMAGAGASPDNKRWHNARAYWWDEFRRRMRAGEIDIDPNDTTLSDELMTPEYQFAPKGGLLVESKDNMRKRNVKSPDFADAAIYAATDLADMLGDPLFGMEPGDHIGLEMDDTWQRDFLDCW